MITKKSAYRIYDLILERAFESVRKYTAQYKHNGDVLFSSFIGICVPKSDPPASHLDFRQHTITHIHQVVGSPPYEIPRSEMLMNSLVTNHHTMVDELRNLLSLNTSGAFRMERVAEAPEPLNAPWHSSHGRPVTYMTLGHDGSASDQILVHVNEDHPCLCMVLKCPTDPLSTATTTTTTATTSTKPSLPHQLDNPPITDACLIYRTKWATFVFYSEPVVPKWATDCADYHDLVSSRSAHIFVTSTPTSFLSNLMTHNRWHARAPYSDGVTTVLMAFSNLIFCLHSIISLFVSAMTTPSVDLKPSMWLDHIIWFNHVKRGFLDPRGNEIITSTITDIFTNPNHLDDTLFQVDLSQISPQQLPQMLSPSIVCKRIIRAYQNHVGTVDRPLPSHLSLEEFGRKIPKPGDPARRPIPPPTNLIDPYMNDFPDYRDLIAAGIVPPISDRFNFPRLFTSSVVWGPFTILQDIELPPDTIFLPILMRNVSTPSFPLPNDNHSFIYYGAKSFEEYGRLIQSLSLEKNIIGLVETEDHMYNIYRAKGPNSRLYWRDSIDNLLPPTHPSLTKQHEDFVLLFGPNTLIGYLFQPEHKIPFPDQGRQPVCGRLVYACALMLGRYAWDCFTSKSVLPIRLYFHNLFPYCPILHQPHQQNNLPVQRTPRILPSAAEAFARLLFRMEQLHQQGHAKVLADICKQRPWSPILGLLYVLLRDFTRLPIPNILTDEQFGEDLHTASIPILRAAYKTAFRYTHDALTDKYPEHDSGPYELVPLKKLNPSAEYRVKPRQAQEYFDSQEFRQGSPLLQALERATSDWGSDAEFGPAIWNGSHTIHGPMSINADRFRDRNPTVTRTPELKTPSPVPLPGPVRRRHTIILDEDDSPAPPAKRPPPSNVMFVPIHRSSPSARMDGHSKETAILIPSTPPRTPSSELDLLSYHSPIRHSPSPSPLRFTPSPRLLTPPPRPRK